MTEYGDRFNAAVAEELRVERSRKRITYAQIIERTGLAQSTLQRYLKGERDIPTSALRDLCRALNVPVTVIVDRAEDAVNQH